MNNHLLFEAVGEADEALLARAAAAGAAERETHRGRLVKIALVAAALIAALGVSAAAAYRFMLPRGLEDAMELASPRITAVVDTDTADADAVRLENKTVATAGYNVSFEAIASGRSLRAPFINGANEPDFFTDDKTYAIFTVTREDGGKVLDFDRMTGADIGCIVSLKGYAPNPGMFQNEYTFYDANDRLYLACDVTRALIFADRELTISVVGYFAPNHDIIRMDENGDPAFTDAWNGIAASFPLKLDTKYANPEAQAAYMAENPCFITDPDYSESDARLAASRPEDAAKYIGDNKWSLRNRIEFREIPYAEEYLSRRGMWEQPGVKLLTAETLENAVMPVLEALAAQIDAEETPYEEQMERLDAAAISPDAFPAALDRFALPDGSTVFYAPENSFVRVRPDGVLCFVFAACESVLIEVEGTNSFGALYSVLYSGDEPPYLLLCACFLDGRSVLDIPHGAMPDEALLARYDGAVSQYKTREDAVFNYVSEYADCRGSVFVRP